MAAEKDGPIEKRGRSPKRRTSKRREAPSNVDDAASTAGEAPPTDADAVVYRALLDAVAAGRPVVLATVVGARGSTPRGVGSKMLIDPVAGLVGTIGGGCGEGEVIEVSSSVLASGRTRRVRVELLDAEDSWSPAVCGGVMEILLEPVNPDVD